MEQQKALELLEQARRTQSCDLVDGLIDDLIPYWTVVEKAFKNIIGDDGCREVLDLLASDGEAERAAYNSEHGAFLMALMIRYKREAAARQSNGTEDGQPEPKVTYAEDTLVKDYPEVADFIEHGLYEAFSVPDAYGTFDLPVYPNSCRVTAEYFNPAGSVSGYVLDNGKMLLVTREGNGEEDRVSDVRYAEATTNNIHLVIRQCEGRPFEWDAIESPDHDRLLRDGAIPTMA